MSSYKPTRIIIDRRVRNSDLAGRILSKFPEVPREFIDDISLLKKEQDHTVAKRTLLLTRHEGQAVKSCQGKGDYVCCNYYTMSFVSNCHFECTYCILQDYLKNNPVITLFANVEEILAEAQALLSKNPGQMIRIGTGELADSLALDDLTEFSKTLVPWAASNPNVILELKTKSDCVENLLALNHRRRTVISWSINPQKFIDAEEFKTASLNDRLQAARRVANAGYPVAFHLDPLLALPGWEEEYPRLIEEVADTFKPHELAWISMGSLRFTPGLKKIMAARFPASNLLTGELIPTPDGKVRYFREIREELYTTVKKLVDNSFPNVSNYLCMETRPVWRQIYGSEIPDPQTLENRLSQAFLI